MFEVKSVVMLGSMVGAERVGVATFPAFKVKLSVEVVPVRDGLSAVKPPPGTAVVTPALLVMATLSVLVKPVVVVFNAGAPAEGDELKIVPLFCET